MKGKKIVGLVLFVFVILNMLIFSQEEAEAAGIDYIVLTDAPNGTELVTVVLPVGGQVTAYASGYNISSGYEGLVVVDWYELFPWLGTLDNSTGTSSTYTAGSTEGITTIQGDYPPFINDTFDVNILSPTVDYIQIRDAPGGIGVNLCDPASYPSYPMGSVDIYYGAAYNFTTDYIGDVNASSTWISTDPTIVSVTSPGSLSTITCNDTNWGTVTITLSDTEGHQNTTQVTVLGPSVDFIIIRDAAGGLGNVIGAITFCVYETADFYAAGYNATFGYLGDVSVNWWSDDPNVGDITPANGTMTTFTAQWVTADSTCTVWADYGSGITNSTGILTVLTPRVDFLLLTNCAHENCSEIPDMDWNVSEPLPIFASGYNNTGPLYVGPVEVNWTDTPDRGDFNNLTGTSTIFTGDSVGLTTIKGESTKLNISDDFQLNLLPLPGNVDFIIITDSPNGTALDLLTLPVGGKITAYASGYNITSGYAGLVEVNWSDSPDLGSFDNPTGSSTTFTAGLNGGMTTITGQNDTLGISDIFTVNILPPTIDSIILTNLPNGTELTTVILNTGEHVTAYASGYNTTSGYLGLIEVNWSESAGLGSLDNLTGTSSTF